MRSCLVLSAFLVALALALAALAFLLIQASPATEESRRTAVAAEATRTAQDLQERQQKAEINTRLYSAWTPALQLAGSGVILAVPIGAALWLYERGRKGRKDHNELVVVADGIPVPRDRLLAGAYDATLLMLDVAGRRQAQVEAARNPVHQLPPTLRTYAPRYGSPRVTTGRADTPAAPPETPTLAAPRARSFSDLVQAGLIAPNTGLLLLGMAAGDTPLLAAPTEVNSVGLAGLPGSGKSNTQAVMAAQLAMLGHRLFVIDPHAHMSEQSLTRRLVGLDPALWRPPAVERNDILDLLRYIAAEVEARKAGRVGHPWAIVVDEVNDVLDDRSLAAVAGPLFVNIARYRKTGIILFLAGQIWRMKDMGDPIKYVMPTRIVHRLDQAQAVPLLPPGEAADVPRLPTGTAKAVIAGAVQTVAVPEITAPDMARMGSWIASTGWHANAPGYEPVRIADVLEGRVVSGGRSDSASWATPSPPPPGRPTLRIVPNDNTVPVRTSTAATPPELDSDADTVPVRTSTAADPQSARVVELFGQGVSRNSICVIVYGAKTPRTLRLVNDALTAAGVLDAGDAS